MSVEEDLISGGEDRSESRIVGRFVRVADVVGTDVGAGERRWERREYIWGVRCGKGGRASRREHRADNCYLRISLLHAQKTESSLHRPIR